MLNVMRDELIYLFNQPYFVGHQNTPQSIPNGVYTAVALDANDVDTYSGHSTVTNNTRYVVQQPGNYLCVGHANWASGTGQKAVQFKANGATFYPNSEASLGSASGGFGGPIAVAMISMVAGDYLELFSFQQSGGAVNLGSASLSMIGLHA